jgi:hypothetical protein
LADDRLSLTFETLSPKDEFEISMISSYGETPNVIEVRHEAGLATKSEMQTTAKPGAFLMVVVLTLFLLAFFFVLYQVAATFGPMLFPGQ